MSEHRTATAIDLQRRVFHIQTMADYIATARIDAACELTENEIEKAFDLLGGVSLVLEDVYAILLDAVERVERRMDAEDARA